MALPDQIFLKQVSRSFDRSFALHRVTTSFRTGTITAVIGGNGAGKSTLLSLLATLDQPSHGEIFFDQLSAARFARQHRHRIGWVGHQTLLYEELSAYENLNFYGAMYGLDQLPQRIEAWLTRLQLHHARNQRVRSFSRGMKQRLTIARALLPNPRLLLLDEPATGLDQTGIALITDLLADLRTRDRIIILVSHNFDLVEALANDLLILNRGKLAKRAPISDFESVQHAYRLYGASPSPSDS